MKITVLKAQLVTKSDVEKNMSNTIIKQKQVTSSHVRREFMEIRKVEQNDQLKNDMEKLHEEESWQES